MKKPYILIKLSNYLKYVYTAQEYKMSLVIQAVLPLIAGHYLIIFQEEVIFEDGWIQQPGRYLRCLGIIYVSALLLQCLCFILISFMLYLAQEVRHMKLAFALQMFFFISVMGVAVPRFIKELACVFADRPGGEEALAGFMPFAFHVLCTAAFFYAFILWSSVRQKQFMQLAEESRVAQHTIKNLKDRLSALVYKGEKDRYFLIIRKKDGSYGLSRSLKVIFHNRKSDVGDWIDIYFLEINRGVYVCVNDVDGIDEAAKRVRLAPEVQVKLETIFRKDERLQHLCKGMQSAQDLLTLSTAFAAALRDRLKERSTNNPE
ncbi:hypothetical protein PQ465_12775 [Sphingobacterium oryzagri]|uniref:Uncharacterized protein n=1 Tax=Sphingobacterium oryzagri TaxID=3025669 RepID=A0ABY7WDA6_9SPHI|nr:hypothetical protein [Sphingobacterium sp. KACC 22765]WDF67178.1 hypothetical protein PQ465_12775 [Sphingobacterium sp. KACC 22765]